MRGRSDEVSAGSPLFGVGFGLRATAGVWRLRAGGGGGCLWLA